MFDFLHKVLDYLESLWHLALGGFKFSRTATVVKRWDICRNCPDFNEDTGACDVCGCHITPGAKGLDRLMSKLHFPSEQCPRKYWGKET